MLISVNSYAEGASGLFLNALTNSKFPVRKAAKVIAASPRPAFGFTHKSFGNDTDNVQELISLIMGSRSTVHVVVYGDCGPCRPPRRPAGLFRLIAPHESISSLNRKLEKSDTKVLSAFNKEWTRLEQYLPALPGVTYTFEEGLEDNYSNKAWSVLHSLAKQIFAHRSDVTFARNPLRPGRYSGRKEIHSYSLKAIAGLASGDIANGDGENLCFEGERCDGYSFEQVREWVLYGRSHNITTLIYRPDIQGLTIGSGNNLQPIPPNQRAYQISEARKLKQLLQ